MAMVEPALARHARAGTGAARNKHRPRGTLWEEGVNAASADVELQNVRECVRRDRPLGTSEWTFETAKALKLEALFVLADARGRPSRPTETSLCKFAKPRCYLVMSIFSFRYYLVMSPFSFLFTFSSYCTAQGTRHKPSVSHRPYPASAASPIGVKPTFQATDGIIWASQ